MLTDANAVAQFFEDADRLGLLARVRVFDRHLAEAGLPAGSPAIASHPALREDRQGSEKAGDIPSAVIGVAHKS